MSDITRSRTVATIREIKSMGMSELERLIPEYEAEATDIDAQIRNRRTKARIAATTIDPDWYSRAMNALKVKRLYIRVMCEQRKYLRRLEADREGKSFDATFKDVARELLAEETYEMLIVETKAVMANTEEDTNGNR